jgi:hypothetical protein
MSVLARLRRRLLRCCLGHRGCLTSPHRQLQFRSQHQLLHQFRHSPSDKPTSEARRGGMKSGERRPILPA